jgi:hypothetical protein
MLCLDWESRGGYICPATSNSCARDSTLPFCAGGAGGYSSGGGGHGGGAYGAGGYGGACPRSQLPGSHRGSLCMFDLGCPLPSQLQHAGCEYRCLTEYIWHQGHAAQLSLCRSSRCAFCVGAETPLQLTAMSRCCPAQLDCCCVTISSRCAFCVGAETPLQLTAMSRCCPAQLDCCRVTIPLRRWRRRWLWRRRRIWRRRLRRWRRRRWLWCVVEIVCVCMPSQRHEA